MSLLVCVRGGGDLGSGAALRLHRAGMRVVVSELPKPLAVRRTVAFAEALYAGEVEVEGVVGRKAESRVEIETALADRVIPVVSDPELKLMEWLRFDCIVDARLLKQEIEPLPEQHPFTIGLGPGFTVGVNCDAVVETSRGHSLGRVYWEGSSEPDSGIPESVNGHREDRVLRAPVSGYFTGNVKIGDIVKQGTQLGTVAGIPVLAAFDGIVRGLVADQLPVTRGMKIGDLDPRLEPHMVKRVSDKSLAVGGGVLEAILMQADLRQKYCV